jgi:hypothetical protein
LTSLITSESILYIYPFEHIHVTAASPAPFQHPEHSAWSETEKTDYAIAWIEALKAFCTFYAAPSTENISNAEQDSSQWPPQPFPLIFDSMKLHSSCGIFLLLDPTGSVSRIRSCISRALKHEALSTGTAPGLLAQSGFKIPDTIHCTVMRLAVDRADGMTEEELEARWEREKKLKLCSNAVSWRAHNRLCRPCNNGIIPR